MANKKNTKNTRKRKKNIDKKVQKKKNENIIVLILLCVSIVLLGIISFPNVGFLGNILKSFILSLFSSFSYIIFLALIAICTYKIINYKTFRLSSLNKLDCIIIFFMCMFVFVGININTMKENSEFSLLSLKNIYSLAVDNKGIGLIPYLVSFLFFKLIGMVGIVLFVLISSLYLIIKYKKDNVLNLMRSIVSNIKNRTKNIENEKIKENIRYEENYIKQNIDIIDGHFQDLPDLNDIEIEKPKKDIVSYDEPTDFENYPDIPISDGTSKDILRFPEEKLTEECIEKSSDDIENAEKEVSFNEKIERIYNKYKKEVVGDILPKSAKISTSNPLEKKGKNNENIIVEEEITDGLQEKSIDEIENKEKFVEDIKQENKEEYEEDDKIENEENIENTKNEENTEENIIDIEEENNDEEKEYYNDDYMDTSQVIESEYEEDDIVQIEEKKPYVYPTISLLNEYKKVAVYDRAEKIRKAQLLKQTLASFGVEANVENISVGPTITRYEIKPKVGTKVSKITNLTEDLALALAAKAIRIEAPIPGKSYVGVEVPNETSQTVSFKEIIQTCMDKKENYNIVFAMGKDISGEVILSDITKMPHALIAGSTGSGKSVCINTIICSILYNYSPEEVKLILVDPKVVELSIYNKMPHLIIPVVTDMRKTPQALNWAVNEMEKRYALFADTKSKDITSYNQKVEEKLPRIVIIIDELADLMMVAPKDIEEAICRLAQKARACGIHLIVATQRPSVDVITGLIKANIPSRIAFAVSSQTDSRTILDTGGADKLLGKGDMLYSPIGMNKPMRIQGAFLTEEEVEKITDFIEQNNNIANLEQKQQEISRQIDEIVVDSKDKKGSSDDDLYDKVVDFAYENEEISVSLIQRQFRIGYNRASRIVDDMEKNGLVSKSDGSKPRKVIRNQEI